MTRILVVGAGGHGLVVIDILLAMRGAGAPVEPVGVLDDNAALGGTSLLGVPVLGQTMQVAQTSHDAVIVAIGDNGRRQQLTQALRQRGEQFAIARHPSAIVGRGVTIEPGAMICAGVVIGPETAIHEGVILNTSSSVDHHNTIGSFAHVGPGAHCGGTVTIGEGVLVGLGASILPGITLGRASIIGAGAVVTRNVAERVVVTGVPARVSR